VLFAVAELLVRSSDAQKSFNELKIAFTRLPVLTMPNDFGEFTLDTDALDQTIGGALSQIKI